MFSVQSVRPCKDRQSSVVRHQLEGVSEATGGPESKMSSHMAGVNGNEVAITISLLHLNRYPCEPAGRVIGAHVPRKLLRYPERMEKPFCHSIPSHRIY